VLKALLPQSGALIQGVCAFAISLAVASFSYLMIERPALRLKKHFTPHAPQPSGKIITDSDGQTRDHVVAAQA
jgi:peptidoglycan/LPS O-acetylase OafA/YrhL